MGNSANIIPFPSAGRTPSPSDAGADLNIELNEFIPQRNTTALDSNDIYPLGGPTNKSLSQAKKMLDQASDLISSAIDNYDAKNFIEADQATQEFEGLLHYQFMVRDIGDGYGELIRSIWSALICKKGEPLDRKQFVAINGCILKLKYNPNIEFLDAIQLCAKLDEVGLITKHDVLSDFANSVVDLMD